MQIEVRKASWALAALDEVNKTVKMPIKVAWKMAGLQNELRSVVEPFENEQRKLLLEHGAVQKNGQIMLEEPDYEKMTAAEKETAKVAHQEKLDSFNEKMRAMANERADIEFDPISVSEFGDDAEIKAVHLADLAPFLKE